jgi:hypothetical protein
MSEFSNLNDCISTEVRIFGRASKKNPGKRRIVSVKFQVSSAQFYGEKVQLLQ